MPQPRLSTFDEHVSPATARVFCSIVANACERAQGTDEPMGRMVRRACDNDGLQYAELDDRERTVLYGLVNYLAESLEASV